jgi:hypothetical protein
VVFLSDEKGIHVTRHSVCSRLRGEHTDSVCSSTEGWGEYLGLKGEDVTGGWRIMHIEELHKVYLPAVPILN